LMNAFNGFSYFSTSLANTLLLLIHRSVCEKFGLTSWVVFGGVSFLTLGATFRMLADEFQRAIATDRLGSFAMLLIPCLMGIAICSLILMILVRATWSKKR
jgi:hypothetical protein